MSKYLDSTGLSYLWSKIKSAISAHKATVTQTVTSGTEIAEVDGTKIYAPASSAGGGAIYAAKLKAVMATVPMVFEDGGYYTTWLNVVLYIQANGREYYANALVDVVSYDENTGRLNFRVHDFVGHDFSSNSNKGYTIQPEKKHVEGYIPMGLFTISGIPSSDTGSFESGTKKLVIKDVDASASKITTVPAFNVIETQQPTA